MEWVIPLRLLRLLENPRLGANKCNDCFQTVWVFCDRVLSNFPPLQFRRWADLEKRRKSRRGTHINNCNCYEDRYKVALISSAKNLVGMLFSFDCPAFVLTSADGLAGFRLRILSEGS